jgi:hypothetical protein|tara:strand:- start:379 stop:540 length:162 start_codon:yes stop_codon:yes gene_type:complete
MSNTIDHYPAMSYLCASTPEAIADSTSKERQMHAQTDINVIKTTKMYIHGCSI